MVALSSIDEVTRKLSAILERGPQMNMTDRSSKFADIHSLIQQEIDRRLQQDEFVQMSMDQLESHRNERQLKLEARQKQVSKYKT
jgi:hypothetical protein